jgi:hypothetical protein
VDLLTEANQTLNQKQMMRNGSDGAHAKKMVLTNITDTQRQFSENSQSHNRQSHHTLCFAAKFWHDRK